MTQPDTENLLDKFRHKDEWKYEGNNYCVVVSRHSVTMSEYRDRDEGPNRWCIYLYLYPEHELFATVMDAGMWGDPVCSIPFHGGCTYHRVNFDDDKTPCSVQVGCDYNHLHDNEYTRIDAGGYEFFIGQAGLLIDWLKETP